MRDLKREVAGVPRRLPLKTDGSCCTLKIQRIDNILAPARLTAKEKAQKRKNMTFNFARLKTVLVSMMKPNSVLIDDINFACLVDHLNVHHSVLGSARLKAMRLFATPTEKLSKSQIVSQGREDEVVVDGAFAGTLKQFIKT